MRHLFIHLSLLVPVSALACENSMARAYSTDPWAYALMGIAVASAVLMWWGTSRNDGGPSMVRQFGLLALCTLIPTVLARMFGVYPELRMSNSFLLAAFCVALACAALGLSRVVRSPGVAVWSRRAVLGVALLLSGGITFLTWNPPARLELQGETLGGGGGGAPEDSRAAP